MADERLGASFSIDVTALKAGLLQANRLIRESESEFKAAAAGMDDWSNSQEGLEARIKHLTTAQDLQQKKVDALKKQYEEAGYASDDMSAAAVKLRTDINKEQEALNKTEKELRQQREALEELNNSSDDAGKSVKELGDAAEKSSDGFTIAKGAISGLIANGISALAGACKNAIGSIVGLAESTKETRTAFAKLEQSFDTAGFTAETAEKTMSELYGVLGDTDKATEAANLIVKTAKSEKDLEKMTRILTGVYSEYGDSIPTEGLAEAISATSAMSTVQGVLADALEWQGINLDEYNEKLASLSTEEERSAYIQETLTGLYGESADKYRENNEALIAANEAQLDYDKTLAAFGEKVEPITTKVKEGFNKILEKVLELVDGVDLESFGVKIDKAFDTFISDIIPKIIEGLTWIKDNKDEIIAGITGIGAAFAALKVVSLIQSVVGALKGMTLAQAALNLVMSMNPIGLIIAAVAGLVAAFVVLWKKCDGFREFWINLWDKIKSAFAAVIDWIKTNWQALILFLINPAAGVFKYLYDNSEAFRKFIDKTLKKIKKFFTDTWSAIKKAFSDVSSFFTDIFTKAWNGIKKAWNGTVKFFGGIWSGIKSAFSAVVSWFGNTFTSAWNAIKSAFGSVYSFFSGVWTSIKNVFSSVTSFFSNAFTNAWNAIKNAFSSVGEFFGGIWETIKSKFTNIGQKVGESVGGAFRSSINAVLATAENVLNAPINAINSLSSKVNSLTGAGIGYLSTFSLPRMARGGVVEQATTAIIGEDGAEAVVPLERNTEWIKAVAKEMAAAQPQGVVVNQTNNYSQAHSRLELYKTKQATAAAVRLAMGRA